MSYETRLLFLRYEQESVESLHEQFSTSAFRLACECSNCKNQHQFVLISKTKQAANDAAKYFYF
jgi:hypothetical protein